MNYFEILIQTYIDTKDKTYLRNAYFREFKKAEAQYFPSNEFYAGCMKQIESGEYLFQKELKENPKASLDKLYIDLQRRNYLWRGELTFRDLQIIKDALKEAYSSIRPDDQIKEGKEDYTSKEYALAYLFDLDVQGKNIPIRTTDAEYDKKEIQRQAIKRNFPKKVDSFYRAVFSINEHYDRNNPKELSKISMRWRDAVKELSMDWSKLEEYLKSKKL